MTNKIKVSNEFINLPAKLEARGFDMIFFVAHKLQDEEVAGLNVVSFTRKEIIDTLGLNKTIGYKAIDKVISNMMNNKIDYSTEDNSFISFLFAEYIRDSEEMSIRVTDRMAKFFLHLSEQYTIADLYIISRLKSIFSKRIYMLILQYKNLKDNRTIEVNEFKKMLQVEGRYKTKQHLNDYILDVAKKEINAALPKINLRYEITKNSNKNQYITFYFNTDFMTREIQQEQEQAEQQEQDQPQVQKREAIFISEPVQYNNNIVELKSEIPTEEEIYIYMQTSMARINVKEFIEFYNHRNWKNNKGFPIAWRSKVEKWGVNALENPEVFKRNAEAFNKWEKQYENKEKYTEMTQKLKPFNITSEKFIKAIVNSKMEHLFNFEKGCFKNLDDDELEQEERQFINYWSEYKEKDNTELREEDYPF